MPFSNQHTSKALNTSPLTKEAVDDSKEAAHGADHRGNNLISPLNLLVTPQAPLSQTQQLVGGSHGDRSGRWGGERGGGTGFGVAGDVKGGADQWVSPIETCLPANVGHRKKAVGERAGVGREKEMGGRDD